MLLPWLTLVMLTTAAPDTRVRWMDLSPEARAELLRSVSGKPVSERVLENSRKFLDTPYLNSPLGEGDGFDADPTERYDAVDCLTFVEQTLAMSLADEPARAPELLRALRYDRAVTYADRNHLMEAQWLPANVRKGFIRDVTRRYGGADAVDTRKVLTKVTWGSQSSQALALPKERQLTGAYPLTLIPLDKVMAHARGIPSGTILLVVRDEHPGKATRVTHLGFVVQKKKRTYLRHAARNAYGRVVDEDLETFLLRNSRYGKWRVSGVSLYEVVPPPARDAAVADTSQP